MKLVGIVCEYNPFHNGHAYLISEAKRLSGADACVVVMSGMFTQRGELAIMDKWKRAELALSNGADLVLEIPVAYVVSDAKRYGSAGVSILRGLGCDAIAFGSESGDIEALRRVSKNLDEKADLLDNLISSSKSLGLSYPAARQAAYEEVFADSEYIDEDAKILSSSNDILGIEYIRAAGDMEIYAVARRGAGYHDELDESMVYQSASGIRKAIEEGMSVSSFVPSDVAYELSKISRDDLAAKEASFFDMIRYAIMRTPASLMEEAPSGGEGLSNRLKASATKAESIEELIEAVKSKRYTYTRISRLLVQVLLGIKRCDILDRASYARVLGFNETGRKALSDIKKNEKSCIPVITNLNKEGELLLDEDLRLLELDGMAVNIYNLICDKALYSNSDRVKKPILKK